MMIGIGGEGCPRGRADLDAVCMTIITPDKRVATVCCDNEACGYKQVVHQFKDKKVRRSVEFNVERKCQGDDCGSQL
jgi:hypothetical protein